MKGLERNEVPSHWELATMGDIATVVGGSTPKSGQLEYWDGDIPWLAVSDLTGYKKKHIARGARSITKAGYESCSTHLVPAGTVLFSSRAPIGYLVIAEQPLCTSQGFKSFVLDSGMSPDFVYWYLKYARPLAESMASGNTFKELNGKSAARLPIPIPPRKEQDRIAVTLDGLWARMREGEALFASAADDLRRYRESVFTAAVTGRLTGDTHNAATSADEVLACILTRRPQRWDATGMGRRSEPASPVAVAGFPLPRAWTWATVDQLAVGVQYGSSAKTSSDNADAVPVLRMGNIVDGRLDLSSLKYLPRDHAEFPALLLADGDLVFNRTNSPELVGKCAVVRMLEGDVSFASYLIRVRFAAEVEPQFIAYFLNSPYGRAWVRENVNQQVGQANVNGSKLRALTVPFPPPDEQRQICAEVERLLDHGVALGEALKKSAEDGRLARQSLLHTAMTGRLTAPQASDEDARDLLARAREARGSQSKSPSKRRRAVLVRE